MTGVPNMRRAVAPAVATSVLSGAVGVRGAVVGRELLLSGKAARPGFGGRERSGVPPAGALAAVMDISRWEVVPRAAVTVSCSIGTRRHDFQLGSRRF